MAGFHSEAISVAFLVSFLACFYDPVSAVLVSRAAVSVLRYVLCCSAPGAEAGAAVRALRASRSCRGAGRTTRSVGGRAAGAVPVAVRRSLGWVRCV